MSVYKNSTSQSDQQANPEQRSRNKGLGNPANDAIQAVEDAVRLIFTNDSSLLKNDVAERAICSKLAAYLEPHFPNHKVDIEYNRHGLEPKKVYLPEYCRGGGEKKIYPDVVVHQRGHDNQNLLVIQAKKESNREPRECDRAIVVAMKHEFQYKYGLLIEFPSGPKAMERKAKLEWI
jgi:hypothetical protein